MALANRISEEILKAGGKSYYVGGYVRDQLLGLESKDIDMEVFGIETEVLESILSNFGKIKFEGKSYGVYKIGDIDIRGLTTLMDPK